MKNLKYLFVAIFGFAIVGVSGVFAAAYVDEETMPPDNAFMGWYQDTTVEEKEGVYYVTMGTNISTDFIIQKGEEVVLDLNGYTLENFTLGCEAIKVLAGGKLTIVDSSTEKTGTITQKDGSTYGVITNLGTLIIQGGNFITNQNFYIVRNEADMIIEGGKFSSTGNTSMIGNIRSTDEEGNEILENEVIPKLVINGGEFKAVSNVVINNQNSVVEINGGNLTSEKAYALDNLATATVTNGTLISESYSAIRMNVRGEEIPKNLTLTISGGNFVSLKEAKSDIVLALGDIEAPASSNLVTITGGTFSNDVSGFLGDAYEVVTDSEGNQVVQEKHHPSFEQPEPEEPSKPSEEIPNTPQTYDSVIVSVGIGVLSFIAIASGIILAKKGKLFN